MPVAGKRTHNNAVNNAQKRAVSAQDKAPSALGRNRDGKGKEGRGDRRSRWTSTRISVAGNRRYDNGGLKGRGGYASERR